MLKEVASFLNSAGLSEPGDWGWSCSPPPLLVFGRSNNSIPTKGQIIPPRIFWPSYGFPKLAWLLACRLNRNSLALLILCKIRMSFPSPFESLEQPEAVDKVYTQLQMPSYKL